MNDKKRSPREFEFAVRPGPGTRLPAGGWIPPYGHIGHWEVTGKVIEEMGFTAPAADILCDASQDPDFYDFGTVMAHAQTPDGADLCKNDENGKNKRQGIIDKAIGDYVAWVNAQLSKCASALAKDKVRLSLYWLGYALHGVEDLAVHKGMTNGEHAAAKDSPDYQAADVALSYVYARRMLDAVRNALGQEAFDRLRNHDGDGKLGFLEKRDKNVHPGGWDIDNHLSEYYAAGDKYKTIVPAPEPVRWDREYVLQLMLEGMSNRRAERMRAVRRSSPTVSANPHRRFEVITPLAPLSRPAKWTVLVYMAGDDSNPQGIEYAISQDLAEIKKVGSTDSVNILAQTDKATELASYRYRLRRATDLESDQLECFNGDLNTGSTKTLVDFVKWGVSLFPAERTALILWGHGSGHDDQNIYRAVRGSVNPRTAAQLARRRLGFFSGTRRAMLEQGPTRGYGYDDTAGDFLDNAELRKALLQVKDILGRNLDILGFDACLMAMVEVAYQIQDVADILVASERTEPGDGWWYNRALGGLASNPDMAPRALAGDIVTAYRDAYSNQMTLSAIDLAAIPKLAGNLTSWTHAVADEADAAFHLARRAALDCSPRPSDGYCDLGSFLEAAGKSGQKGSAEAKVAQKTLQKAVFASCGGTSGLTIYAPGNFTPQRAGSTDALYLGLNFVREKGWGDFLRKVYPPLKGAISDTETLPIPSPVAGLDRYNARRVLAALRSRASGGWVDRLRGEVLSGPYEEMAAAVAGQVDKFDPPKDRIKSPRVKTGERPPEARRRILILPGIMGSLLHDRSGKLGGVWIDPWNLVFGDDFDELTLKWDMGAADRGRTTAPVQPLPLSARIPDADDAVNIEAYGVIPLIYDRLALALMHEFGPVVEYAPFDWRQPIDYLGTGIADRIDALFNDHPGIEIALVAHSMGGLVVTDGLTKLQATSSPSLGSIKGLVVLGTPFLGSVSALQALRAEGGGLGLLKLLGRKSTADIQNIVQTFRGLCDMLPSDQEELLKCPVFAPGPLSRISPDDDRLDSCLRLVHDLPPTILQRTRAIVCTTKNTPGPARVRDDGSMDYSCVVAGDGTVSAKSALNGGGLLGMSVEVNEKHTTLPLDGNAIEHTVGWIAKQFGVSPSKSLSRGLPGLPEASLPKSIEDLVHHLEEAEDDFTLGDFLALISLM